MSIDKAEVRIDALVDEYDLDFPIELRIVPYDVGKPEARRAFAIGLRTGHAQLLQEVA